MNIHFFFQGKLSREEASSAFLATMLEQVPGFRAYLFRRCDVAEYEQEAGRDWTVVTEESEFDVLMQSPGSDWVVLIENKIKSGSVAPDQLSSYYRKLRAESPIKILLVYLTPKPGTGQVEFDRLRSCVAEDCCDRFVHLSWNDVFGYESLQEKVDGPEGFVCSGFAAIKRHVETAPQEKYYLQTS